MDREKTALTVGDGPALGTKRGNSVRSLAKMEIAESAGFVSVESAVAPTKPHGASPPAQNESEAEGDRLNERVEKRIADIEAGKVKMKRYTLDEHVRYLDDMLDG